MYIRLLLLFVCLLALIRSNQALSFPLETQYSTNIEKDCIDCFHNTFGVKNQFSALEEYLKPKENPASKYLGLTFLHSPLDRLFYAYGSCFRLDWRFLKAVAKAESALNPKAGLCYRKRGKRGRKVVASMCKNEGLKRGDPCKKNCRFVGLFQTSEYFCREAMEEYRGRDVESDYRQVITFSHTPGQNDERERVNPPLNYGMKCIDHVEEGEVGRIHPEVNTSVTAYHFDLYLRHIEYHCPNATLEAKLALLYTGHNNGPEVLKHVLVKKGCVISSKKKLKGPKKTRSFPSELCQRRLRRSCQDMDKPQCPTDYSCPADCKENCDMRCMVRDYYDQEKKEIYCHNRYLEKNRTAMKKRWRQLKKLPQEQQAQHQQEIADLKFKLTHLTQRVQVDAFSRKGKRVAGGGDRWRFGLNKIAKKLIDSGITHLRPPKAIHAQRYCPLYNREGLIWDWLNLEK